MTDLVTWLRSQLDEDASLAEAVDGDDVVDFVGEETVDHGERKAGKHIRRWVPSRVLADIDGKRRILDLHAVDDNGAGHPDSRFCQCCFGDRHYNADVSNHTGEGRLVWCETVRLLALPYADRPGYLEEWRP